MVTSTPGLILLDNPFFYVRCIRWFCVITGVLKNRAFILKGTAYNEQMEIVAREQRVCRRDKNFRQCIDEKYLGEIFMKY